MSRVVEFVNRKKYAPLFVVGLIAAAFLAVFCFIHYSDGDDAFFAEATSTMPFLEYLKYRYATWTGRMGGESLVYVVFGLGGIWFWRVVNALMVVALPLLMLKLALISNPPWERPKNWDTIRLLAILFSGYLLMDVMTFGHSAVWVNGSIFYTWSIVFGLLALIPAAKYFYGCRFKTWELAYALPMSVIAAMSIEQVGAVVFAFVLVAVVAGKKRGMKIHWGLVAQLMLILVAMIVLLCAPGNAIRIQAVFDGWITRDYLAMGSGHHLFITYQWLISSFANEGRLFFLCIWVAGMMLLAERGQCSPKWFVPTSLFVLVALLPFANVHVLSNVGIDDINPLALEVLPSWSAMTPMNVVALFWWTLAVGFTVPFLWKVSRSIMVLLVFAAAVASEGMMYFSPTIYASGERVYYMSCLLFVFIMLQFWLKLKTEKLRNLYVVSVVLLGMMNMLMQAAEVVGKLSHQQ